MTQPTKADDGDDGAGCVLLLGLLLVGIGGCFVWGPMALVVVGAILIFLVLMS